MSNHSIFPSTRLRRLRGHPQLRALLSEHQLTVNDLVLPLFVKAGSDIQQPIASMPGHHQFSVDQLDAAIAEVVALNIPAVLLFGIPAEKDATGSSGCQTDGVVQQAIRRIKSLAPDLLVIADVCLCEYTEHGHCGVVEKRGNDAYIHNDKTLPLLAKQAVSLVQAGADVVAPSGMMDGMVAAIRAALDAADYTHVPILSYAVKYASNFYGPFRHAAGYALQFGDRKTYQMDPANGSEALREAAMDLQEGADMLMVKPAGNYLDVIYRVKQRYPEVPLAAYQVSGEFAMLKAAAEKGWLDPESSMLESVLAIKRAGADFIITYFAKDIATLLSQ